MYQLYCPKCKEWRGIKMDERKATVKHIINSGAEYSCRVCKGSIKPRKRK